MVRRLVLALSTTGLLLAACAAAPDPAPVLLTPPSAAPAPADTAVPTQKNEPTRTGWNRHETVLTQANAGPRRFGKRIGYPVDGAVYAQPLFAPGRRIGGGTHNIAVVATERDSVYAFDADAAGAAYAPLWQRSLLSPGAQPLSAPGDVNCKAILPDVGITGTPVIDQATGTLYVVTTERGGGGIGYYLHALDLDTGRDRVAPARITASAPGTASDAVSGKVAFLPGKEQQRMGLVLTHGVVYAAFASYCDRDPSHGWILGYRATDLSPAATFLATPDDGDPGLRPGGGGMWEAETGLSADDAGSLYVITGNGPFDLNTGGKNTGNSLLRLVPDGATLKIADYFTPFDGACLNDHDQDLGSGAPLFLPGGRLLLVGKPGRIYLTRADRLGGYQAVPDPCALARTGAAVDHVDQELPVDTVHGGVWGSETCWTGGGHTYVYTAGVDDHLSAWSLAGGRLVTPAAARAPEQLSYPGGVPVLSSAGDEPGTAILWLVTDEHSNAVLRAYDPADVSHELYDSGQNARRDALSGYANFTVPTVAGGRVFVGGKGFLAIFGPLP